MYHFPREAEKIEACIPTRRFRQDLVLSGLDGTGKSTQAGILQDRLTGKGVEPTTIWNRWSPSITAPHLDGAETDRSAPRCRDGRIFRFYSLEERTDEEPCQACALAGYGMERIFVQVQSRLFGAGYPRRAIISDRYVYDTLVDMAVNFSLEPGELETLCSHPLLSLFPVPASFVVIDIDPEVGSTRKSDGTPPEYLADRRPFYLEIARLTGAAVVDGNGTIEETAAGIWEGCPRWRKNLE